MALTNQYSFQNSQPLTISKKILVLDLDETLIHCKVIPSTTDATPPNSDIVAQLYSTTFTISKRPGLEEFLFEMSRLYNLVLFTSGVKDYAHIVLKTLNIDDYFSSVLHRGNCHVNSQNKFEKDLSIVGGHPRDMILLDDSLVHVRNQPKNILIIKPFRGEEDDHELPLISKFLKQLANKEDVRPVMERFIFFQEREKFPNPGTKGQEMLFKSQRIQTMQTLNLKSPNQVFTYQLNDDGSEFEDTDENSDGNSLCQRLEKIVSQNEPRKHLKTLKHKNQAKNLPYFKLKQILEKSSKAFNDYNQKSAKKLRNLYETDSNMSIDFLNDFGPENSRPTMTPKSQYSKLKGNQFFI